VIIYILSPAIASSLGQKSTTSNLLLGPYCDTLCLMRPEVLHLYSPKCFYQSNVFLSEKYDVSRIAYTYRVHVYILPARLLRGRFWGSSPMTVKFCVKESTEGWLNARFYRRGCSGGYRTPKLL